MPHVFYQPIAPGRVPDETLTHFWTAVLAANEGSELTTDFQVRWIGMDDETTQQIFDLIRAKDKTGTFTLPEVLDSEGLPRSEPGDAFVLTDTTGCPVLALRITDIYEIPFGQITERDTAVDGTPVRSLDVWKPLHTAYWNPMLEKIDKSLSEDTLVLIEKFELIYDRDAA